MSEGESGGDASTDTVVLVGNELAPVHVRSKFTDCALQRECVCGRGQS